MANWDNQIWAQDRKTCAECGDRFHLSGTEECACRACETEGCDVVVNTKETTICVDCEDTDDACPDCDGEGTPLPDGSDYEDYSRCGNCKGWYESTSDAMDALSESMNPVGGE
jgi:DnaJ-class molecular chaperone